MPDLEHPLHRPAPRPYDVATAALARRVRRHLRHRDDRAVPRDQLRPVRRPGHVHELPAPHGRTLRPPTPHAPSPRSKARAPTACPTVLFLCVHNAGRSQMALGWFNHLAGDRAVAWSGGSEPGSEVNPAAVAAMAEVGIDIAREFPKPWTDEIVRAADVVVTMGCGDACPLVPRQALRGLGARRPRRPRRRRRAPHPRRDPPPGRHPPRRTAHRPVVRLRAEHLERSRVQLVFTAGAISSQASQ